ITFDDSHTWAKPWTFAMNLTHDESQPPFEYACHEGNYGLRNILSAARAEERMQATAIEQQGKKKLPTPKPQLPNRPARVTVEVGNWKLGFLLLPRQPVERHWLVTFFFHREAGLI